MALWVKNHEESRLIEDKPESYIIDLYPEDIKNDLVRVRLAIGKSNLNLISLEYKKRDGVLITLHVTDYNLKLKPAGDMFVFHPENYTGVEINDIRH